jgi:hypothetical protein
MDLKKFDASIKSSLEHLESPLDPGAWLAFKSKLDISGTEELPDSVQPTDWQLKNALDRLEVPYQLADWNKLNARLNVQGTILRLRRTKLAEAAIFLLILANFQGFFGTIGHSKDPVTPPVPKSNVPMAQVRRTTTSKLLSTNQNSFQAFDYSLGNQSFVGALSTPLAAIAEFSEGQFGVLSPTMDGNILVSLAEKATSGIAGIPENGAFANLSTLPQATTSENTWHTTFDFIPGVFVKHAQKSGKLYFGTYAFLAQNNIYKDEFSTQTRNGGVGISVGYRFGKWGIESGASYARPQYAPKKDLQIYAGNPVVGFLGDYVQTVRAEVISVPLKATRRLARIGKGSVHAIAGITANIAAGKHYAYKTEFLPSTSPSGLPNSGPDPEKNPAPVRRSDGLLEGGDLASNAYATADLGFRIEHPIGKRLTAFLAPAIHTALGRGYGPKQERMSAISWQAGVFASL